MNSFNVSDFLKRREEVIIVEGITFDIMSLSDDLISDLKTCDNYNDMLSAAADYGLACDGKRVIEDEYMSSRLENLWNDEALNVDSDPCIKYRVGEKVCAISGLNKFIGDQIHKEEDEAKELQVEYIHVDGDSEIPDIDIGELNADATVAAAAYATATA